MKTLIFFSIAVLIAVSIHSCSDDTLINPGSTTTLSGKIDNWHYGDDKKIIASILTYDDSYTFHVIDTAQISSGGEFKLDLTAPDNSLLEKIASNDTTCTHHTIILPQDAMWAPLVFSVIYNDSVVGHVYMESDTLSIHTGKVYGYYYYFNRSTTMAGSDTCGLSFSDTVVINYDVHASAGWNYTYEMIDKVSSNKLVETISTQEQPVHWYFYGMLNWERRGIRYK